jgi:superoxide dismutase
VRQALSSSSHGEAEFAPCINRDFGSGVKFKEQFKRTGIGNFGNGWPGS